MNFLPVRLCSLLKFCDVCSTKVHVFVSVTQTINTRIDAVNSITLLSRNTVVICGAEAGKQKVKSYNLQTGAELSSLNLDDASGVAGVKLSGNLALAVARRWVQKAHRFL